MLKIFQLSSEIRHLIEKSDEKLYLANSRALLKFIKKCNLVDLLSDDLKTLVKNELFVPEIVENGSQHS